jgi:hypothetical protein
MPDLDDEFFLFTNFECFFHYSGVMTMKTKFAGTKRQMAAILANSSFVAVSESIGALYVPSSTAFYAGVFDVYLKCSKNSPLQMGASSARVYCFSCTLEKMVYSTLSWVVGSIIALSWPLT